MTEDNVTTMQRLTERLTGMPAASDVGREAAVGGLIWTTPHRPIWWQRVRSMIVLLVLGVTAVASAGYPFRSAAGVGVIALATVNVAIRMPIGFRVRDPVLRALCLLGGGVAGVGLTLMSPRSGAVVFAALAVLNATELWVTVPYSVFAVGLSVFYVVAQLALGRSPIVLAVGPVALAAAVLMGFVRRQSTQLAVEAQLVRDSQARSAALDERARIAREIHDVLAHSLAALTVQLETADALLESGRPEQAHSSVLRAGRLAREGMAETRRAIGALRGETVPLAELIRTLAGAYEADLGAPATVQVDGECRDLRPDVGLALYRTAQEAITNVRKHAPGAPVTISLHYGSDEVALDVTSGAAHSGERPLASTGGGYGLTGLRERAELAGGRVDAGPVADGWRVDVRIPA